MTDWYVRWKGWQAEVFGSFGREDALYYTQELNACGIASVLGMRVGEVGYGNGAFAGWVRKSGGYWVGREVIPELQKRAAEAGFDVIPPNSGFSSGCGLGKLNLVVAFDVIEHMGLDEIRTFLVDVKAVLVPGGLLVARFPSGDSPFSKANYHGDLTHRTLLGSSAVHQLAMEAGLEVFQVRSPTLPVWGLGIMRAVRRMTLRALQLFAFSFVRHVLMGHCNGVLSPNMIVVLRKDNGISEN